MTINSTYPNMANMTETYFYEDFFDKIGNMSYYDLYSVKHIPLWEIIVKSIFVLCIIVISLIGNILIIVIVFRNRQMHTATNYYIVNLAVADLMVTVSCTWVALVEDLTTDWVLGAFFCKFNTFMQVLSLVASVLSLTLIAYDRFFGIVFALRAHMTEKRARTSLIVIWLCALAVTIPILLYRKLNVRHWSDHLEKWCDDDFPTSTTIINNVTVTKQTSRTAYYVIVSVVLYFVPMVVMTFAYSIIIMKLWISTIPGEIVDKRVEAQARTKRKVIVMLVVILVVFAVCWLPCQVILLYSELRPDKENRLGDWFQDLQFSGYCMAYSNSALNPLIYAGFNANFKRGLEDVWRCVSCKEKENHSNGKTYGTYELTATTATHV
ncbi:substance-P receptor-like [Ylistrum balloti]|uniref:substance-P receptor-like n=1 Tax=Ylistrum balloti TaxID=509963 RepID=UPI002905EB90|nr:substance-P receptor-like [Ylistrum balloti]